MAQNNHLRTIPLRAPRGVLFDRNGKVLVENTYSYTIALAARAEPNPRDLSDASNGCAAATGADEARIARRRAGATGPTRRSSRFPSSSTPPSNRSRPCMARKLELPGNRRAASADAALSRRRLCRAPVRLRERDPGGAAEPRSSIAGLQPGAIVGQAGLERTYNSRLDGQGRRAIRRRQQRGREIEERGVRRIRIDGARLKLTIDYDLQHALEDAFKAQGFAGAAVFLDPTQRRDARDDEPARYDPNDFAERPRAGQVGAAHCRSAEADAEPALQGKYSPGSTFKILMATAALSEGIITPDYDGELPGQHDFYGHVFHCDKKDGHGTLDLRHAIEQSCNVVLLQRRELA